MRLSFGRSNGGRCGSGVVDKAEDAFHHPQLLGTPNLLRWEPEVFVPRYQTEVLRHIHIHGKIERSDHDGRDAGGRRGGKVLPEGIGAEAEGDNVRRRHQ